MRKTYNLVENCELCGSKNHLIGHHLSYIPEELVTLCYKCHTGIHCLSNLPKDKLDIVMEWINKYGIDWTNGSEKYRKSNYGKEAIQKYTELNREKLRESHRRSYRKHRDTAIRYQELHKEQLRENEKRWRTKNPEKVKEKKRRWYNTNKDKINKLRREKRSQIQEDKNDR